MLDIRELYYSIPFSDGFLNYPSMIFVEFGHSIYIVKDRGGTPRIASLDDFESIEVVSLTAETANSILNDNALDFFLDESKDNILYMTKDFMRFSSRYKALEHTYL